ncbi:MAG TPA: hypothetical protein VJ397_09170 [Thermoplasmata archaeon]|nr:hypothetical protein [Thermoplasmata archaeon]
MAAWKRAKGTRWMPALFLLPEKAGRDLLGWTIPSPVEAASPRAPAPGR